MDISIIILNYKSKRDTLSLVKAVKEADLGRLEYEIMVIDNGSDDGIGEILHWQHPDVKFFQIEKNIGMGAGNNIGLRRAQGKYIVIINPDIVIFRDTLMRLYKFIEMNKKIGVVGPQQLCPNREIQDSCFRWHGLLTPLYRRTPLGRSVFARKNLDNFLMKDYDRKSERKVDWLMGSFLFCRAEALKASGYFDERFFMYFEDTDLCRRLWKKNWQVWYYPNAKAIHNHGRHSARTAWYKWFTDPSARLHIKSWLKYIGKWGIYN